MEISLEKQVNVKPRRNYFKIICCVVASVALTLMLVLVIATFIINIRVMRIVSDSMEPSIPKNTLAFIATFDISTVEVGNVICYKDTNGDNIVHRVYSKVANEDNDVVIRTKGDANNNIDNTYVTKENYIGVMVAGTQIFDKLLDLFKGMVILTILGIISMYIIERITKYA